VGISDVRPPSRVEILPAGVPELWSGALACALSGFGLVIVDQAPEDLPAYGVPATPDGYRVVGSGWTEL
jgi:hypothetical protein